MEITTTIYGALRYWRIRCCFPVSEFLREQLTLEFGVLFPQLCWRLSQGPRPEYERVTEPYVMLRLLSASGRVPDGSEAWCKSFIQVGHQEQGGAAVSKGYRPQGHRPMPTDTPRTASQLRPYPGVVDAESENRTPAPDAFKEIGVRIDQVHQFLIARLAEEDAQDTADSQHDVGYALGFATACIELGDIIGAVRQLEWMRTEAANWNKHPAYHRAVSA